MNNPAIPAIQTLVKAWRRIQTYTLIVLLGWIVLVAYLWGSLDVAVLSACIMAITFIAPTKNKMSFSIVLAALTLSFWVIVIAFQYFWPLGLLAIALSFLVLVGLATAHFVRAMKFIKKSRKPDY